MALTLVLSACGGPDVDGLEEIGTLQSGATLFAAKQPDNFVDVAVVQGSKEYCRASGPMVANLGVCHSTTPDGLMFVTTVPHNRTPAAFCDQNTGEPLEPEILEAPAGWSHDFVIVQRPSINLLVVQCARLRD